MIFFSRIWAIYAVALFLLMMTVTLPVIGFNMIFWSGPRALRRNIGFLHHVFTPVFLTLVGVRLRVEGRQHLDPNQSYVIVGNHRTSLDFIVNAEAFPGVFRFLAKQELQKVPVFGWVVKKMCLTVDRRSAMSRARSVVELRQQLTEGWSIFIYPEGGRNRSQDPLGPFYDGAFRIAIQTGAPLAVQTIVNIGDIAASSKTFGLRPGVVRVVWDMPVPTTGLNAEDIPVLKERVRQLMLQHLSWRGFATRDST